LKTPGGIFDAEALKLQIKELEEKSAHPQFWDDREEAEAVLTRAKRLRDRVEPWEELRAKLEDAHALLALAVEEDEPSLADEIDATLGEVERRYEKLRVLELLNDEMDDAAAFLTIHSGAGGTEACDWVSMLLRMYTRWMDRKEFKSEILDMQEAEGGIKSVTLQVEGDFAFGYLKAETGIHRLVRISPFDSSGRRHTSFASVYVSPVIEDDIEVDIKPDEIRVDTYRAQGAGGQHVNKTDSAVRITHLETGIVVQCQNERSQHKNRATAMKVLRSRLYEYYRRQREAEQAEAAAEKKDISWGNQIRSYVFQPYTMVKDHRTKAETGNVSAVMDGDIDAFIEEYLRYSWEAANVGAS
jgi:peptide chain release factor 2